MAAAEGPVAALGRRAPLSTSSASVLAKSGLPLTISEYLGLKRIVGYPSAARHEASSAKIAEALGMNDLVLHLITSHHGLSRPWLPFWEDGYTISASMRGQEVAVGTGGDLGALQSPVPSRFAELNARWGPWKLAYFEAILRLADYMQSALEQQEDFAD